MLKEVHVKNLKSIKDQKLKLADLNLLTGVNGAGKSTFVQALLLIRQSYKNFFNNPPSLWLGENGDYYSLTNLGGFSDIYHQQAKNSEGIQLSFVTHHDDEFSFKSKPFSIDSSLKSAIEGELSINTALHGVNLGHLSSLFSDDHFQYLAADRIQPKEDYPMFNRADYSLGKDGALTPHFLASFGMNRLPIESLLHEKSDPKADNSLIRQVEFWMQEISPNIQIKARENHATSRIELSYNYYSRNGVPLGNRKPQNVGYGITPTLPVIVALLSAKPGDLIIIENPETHIHPKGQSRIGMLMAKAAQAGVQLIVETHSDHVLNGIRVAAKKNFIEASKITVNFFSRSVDEITEVKQLVIDQNGRIDQWPKGFFDEWDNMLDELL